MRVAVVDIGTNSTRLLIADVENGTVKSELVRRSIVTQLGTGVDADGRLSEEAMKRVYSTLEDYSALIEREQVDRSVAVLTSAVRDAGNGGEFAEAVERRFQLEPHILSGDEEAGLTFLGATSERDPDDATPTVLIDIGGGSTELVIGRGREATFHVSTQSGVVRQTERHLHTDPPTDEELERLVEDVRAIIAQATPESERRAVSRAIAVAGTATSLASIAQSLDPYDPDKVHGYVLSVEECRRLLTELAAMALERRRQVTGLDPARAPTIVAGVAILIEVLGLFDLDLVEVSEHDILRGAALGL